MESPFPVKPQILENLLANNTVNPQALVLDPITKRYALRLSSPPSFRDKASVTPYEKAADTDSTQAAIRLAIQSAISETEKMDPEERDVTGFYQLENLEAAGVQLLFTDLEGVAAYGRFKDSAIAEINMKIECTYYQFLKAVQEALEQKTIKFSDINSLISAARYLFKNFQIIRENPDLLKVFHSIPKYRFLFTEVLEAFGFLIAKYLEYLKTSRLLQPSLVQEFKSVLQLIIYAEPRNLFIQELEKHVDELVELEAQLAFDENIKSNIKELSSGLKADINKTLNELEREEVREYRDIWFKLINALRVLPSDYFLKGKTLYEQISNYLSDLLLGNLSVTAEKLEETKSDLQFVSKFFVEEKITHLENLNAFGRLILVKNKKLHASKKEKND